MLAHDSLTHTSYFCLFELPSSFISGSFKEAANGVVMPKYETMRNSTKCALGPFKIQLNYERAHPEVLSGIYLLE